MVMMWLTKLASNVALFSDVALVYCLAMTPGNVCWLTGRLCYRCWHKFVFRL